MGPFSETEEVTVMMENCDHRFLDFKPLKVQKGHFRKTKNLSMNFYSEE